MLESVKVKVPQKPHAPTKEERQSHEATHCPFRAWCEICVKAKSLDAKHTKQLVDMEHIRVIEFDDAFATDTPGDPNRKISMMVATDSIHGSIFAVVARRTGGQDEFVMVKAELKCDQEPSILDVANALAERCQSTILTVIATPKEARKEVWGVDRAYLTIQGRFRTFREAVSIKYQTEIGLDHVLMGPMVRHCARVVNHFQVKGTGRTPYVLCGARTTLEKLCHLHKCAWRSHSEDGAKLNMRCVRGAFVGTVDRIDEFLLLTPTGAMKTRCLRRLEGNNAWDLQVLNFCVGHPWNATARSR